MADAYFSEAAFVRDYRLLNHEYQNKVGRFLKNLLKLQRAENKVSRDIQKLTGETAAPANAEVRKKLRCSFCGKTEDEVFRLIAGPGAYICDTCVSLCCDLLEEIANERSDDGDGPRDEEINHAKEGKEQV